jgi:hypothetical protein
MAQDKACLRYDLKMKENSFEDMLANTIKMDRKAKPCRWFAFRMRLMLQKKAWQISWRDAMAGTGKLKFAGVSALIVVLTAGGGVGVYAYSSPDVTVLHPLYPIKQGLESTEVYFASTPKMKAEIQLRHAQMRMEEMKSIGGVLQQNQQNGGGQPEEEGMKRTMVIVREQMNDSLAYAADEDSVNEAKEVIDALQKNLQDMDTSLGGISENEIMRERQAVRAHLEDLQQYTKLKLEKVDQVSRQISSPMRIKGPRVIMRYLTDDGREIQTVELTPVTVMMPSPVMATAPVTTTTPVMATAPQVISPIQVQTIQEPTEPVRLQLNFNY